MGKVSVHLLGPSKSMTMVDQILKIKAGGFTTFVYDNQRYVRSGKGLVYYVKRFCSNRIPSDVADYQTEVQGNVLIVKAIKKMKCYGRGVERDRKR